MGGHGEGTSDALVICETEPKFRRFGAEADDVSQGGGRVIGLGFAASLYRLFPWRLREDRFKEGGEADFVQGGIDVVVPGLIAVLSVCHKMHAFTRPGANEYISEVGALHFCHIK